MVEHQILERTQLADFICTHVANITPNDIVKRRIQIAGLMLALCSRREAPRRYNPRVALPSTLVIKEESPAVEPFPLICEKTQCIFFCTGKEKKKTFSRPAKMMDHVESHLRRELGPTVACRHPVCEAARLVLETVNQFKYHVQVVHGITLRDPRYVR